MDDFLRDIIESVEHTYLLNEPTQEEREQTLQHRRAQARLDQKNYRKRHPEKIRMRNAAYSSARTDKSINSDDVAKQLKSQNGLCWWCSKPLGDKWHVDHRIPLTRGGTNTAGNIVIAHPKCNQSKGDKLPWEWSDRLL